MGDEQKRLEATISAPQPEKYRVYYGIPNGEVDGGIDFHEMLLVRGIKNES